jgi:phosphoglycerate dehydrogenase-like enzyme
MTSADKPLVISCPAPRSLDLIFSPENLEKLHARYRIVETTDPELPGLPDQILAEARYIIGQPPLTHETLARLANLKSILNVESNLLNNMPYDVVFERGIHVLITGAVFALPVAEIGLGMALDLARGITDADLAFREGRELWGGEGNASARLLTGSKIGIIGFGDLGKALNRVLSGFRARIRVYDPWLPDAVLREHGVEPADLATVMGESDFVFVVAAVTSENRAFLGEVGFRSMRKGAAFILLSRADVVDFDALIRAVESGHIVAASDVWPEEPLPSDHPVRGIPGFLRSAHRAGALDVAFKKMGEMVLDDMEFMDKGLPPMRLRRAERETVARMRSKPVSVN